MTFCRLSTLVNSSPSVLASHDNGIGKSKLFSGVVPELMLIFIIMMNLCINCMMFGGSKF